MIAYLELKLEVEYDFHPGQPEVRYFTDGSGQEGIDPHITITSVKSNGVEIINALTKEQLDELETQCQEERDGFAEQEADPDKPNES